MDKNTINNLKDIIEKRENRNKETGGEVFAFWGIINVIALIIYRFIIPSNMIWLIMVLLGIIVHISFQRQRRKREGYSTFLTKTLFEIWIFIVVILPITFYIFPVILKMYNTDVVVPIVALFLALGMFISGVITRKWSLRAGGGIFLIGSILLALNPENKFLYYLLAHIFGLIIPGMISNIEKKKGTL